MKILKYFAIECKCGHVGKEKCIIITFPIRARDAKEAAKIARNIPRVKHDHKDCIISVREINKPEYRKLRKKNNHDKYLLCHSKQEQKEIDLTERLVDDMWNINRAQKEHVKEEQKRPVAFGKTIIRNPRKFSRLYRCQFEG